MTWGGRKDWGYIERMVRSGRPPTPWAARAKCRGSRANFFPPRGGSQAARAVCAGCPVVSECLEYALEWEPQGIWGGMSERARRRLRSQRKALRVAS